MGDLLPSQIVWRPKQGFATPVRDWFRGDLAHELERQLRGHALGELGYLDPGAIQRVLDVHRRGRADRSFQLWNLLNLSIWFDRWIANERAPAI